MSSGKDPQQGGHVVAGTVHDSVDEERGRAAHLTGRRRAANVPANALEHPFSAAVAVEPRDVEPQLERIAAEVVLLERRLAVEEHVVHPPEPALERGGLRGPGGGEGVRVDLGEREVPEGEADALAQLGLDAFDCAEGRARVRALVVAVLDDDRRRGGAADVIDHLVQRLDDRLPLLWPFVLPSTENTPKREDFTYPSST